MRTTIDLPDDLHALALSIARDNKITLSDAVTRLMRASLRRPSDFEIRTSPRTGLPVFSSGSGPVTSEDVRSLEDDE